MPSRGRFNHQRSGGNLNVAVVNLQVYKFRSAMSPYREPINASADLLYAQRPCK